VIAIFLLASIPAPAFADDQPRYQVKYLFKGEVAPFDGMLYNHEAQAKMQVDLKYCREEAKLQLDYEVKKAVADKQLEVDLLKANVDFWKERYNISKETSTALEDRYLKEIKRSQKTVPPGVWVLLGAVLGGGMVFLGGAVQAELAKGQ
jgi:hypothetical protein